MSRRTSRPWVLAVSIAVLTVTVLGVSSSAAQRTRVRGVAQLPWKVERRALLRELAILRRPQRSSDLDPTVLDGHLLPGRVTYDRGLVRRALTASGDPIFLIPVEHRPRTQGSPGLLVAGIGGAACCASAAEIRAQGTWTTSGPPNRVLMVVPDGVARIRLTLRTGPDPHHPPAVAGKVHDNVIVMRLPFAAETLSGDPVTWYGPTGRVVKRFLD